MARATHAEVIGASPESCFDVLADLEAYPDWQSAVKAVGAIERDGDGRPSVVEFVTDAKVREVKYTLAYRYDRPRSIAFDYVDGDAKTVEGGFDLEDLGNGSTRVTYTLDVDAGGRLVPGKLKQSLADQAVESTLRKLGQRVSRTG
jgi:ribosome-associated toxin RatA of RatAB toxin-antitoxin module